MTTYKTQTTFAQQWTLMRFMHKSAHISLWWLIEPLKIPRETFRNDHYPLAPTFCKFQSLRKPPCVVCGSPGRPARLGITLGCAHTVARWWVGESGSEVWRSGRVRV